MSDVTKKLLAEFCKNLKPVKLSTRIPELRIYDQLSKDTKEAGTDSFTIGDVRKARDKAFTGEEQAYSWDKDGV